MTSDTQWYSHHSEVPLGAWRWAPEFLPIEMADRKTGELLCVPVFMDWLLELRIRYAAPMIITSGHRTAAHQQILPGFRTTGSHVDGQAVDVRVYGPRAHRLLALACQLKVKGVGVHQTGEHRLRYLHLDMWDKAPEGARPFIWSY